MRYSLALRTQRGYNSAIELWLDSIQPFTIVSYTDGWGPFSFFSFLMANLIMAVITVQRTRRERWATKPHAAGMWYLAAGEHDTYS